MDRKEEMNQELQQVGAYGSYHKRNQRNVPLLETEAEKQDSIEASQDRAQ